MLEVAWIIKLQVESLSSCLSVFVRVILKPALSCPRNILFPVEYCAKSNAEWPHAGGREKSSRGARKDPVGCEILGSPAWRRRLSHLRRQDWGREILKAGER